MIDTIALKHLIRMTAGQSPSSDDVTVWEGGGLPFLQGNAEFGPRSPRPIYRCDAAPKTCQARDVLLSVRAPVGALNIADRAYGIGRGLCAVHPVRLHHRYTWWLMHGLVPSLQSMAVGSTYDAVAAEDVGGLRAPSVTVAQQRAIADFLDSETVRIDTLIAKKRGMIELLDERLAARIRGTLFAIDAPHLPLKRFWRVVDCKHRTPSYVDSGYPVVSPGDTTPGRLDLSRAHRFVDRATFDDLTAGGRHPQRGDIIYSRNASIGIASFVDTEESFCMGQDVCLITSKEMNQLYLTQALNTLGKDQLEVEKVGSTFSRVNVATILELRVPCPPPSLQARVAAGLDSLTNTTEAAVGAIQRQVNLLVDHRQALITAAVTGEMEVPGVAA